MRPQVAYVIDPEDDGTVGLDRTLLVDAFDRAGLDTTVVAWDSSIDWSDFDLVFIAHLHEPVVRRNEFLQWARHVEGETALMNPVLLLVRTTDRTHLRDLARRGIECVPRLWFEPGDAGSQVRVDVLESGWSRFLVRSNTEESTVVTESVEQVVQAVATILAAGGVASVEQEPGGRELRAFVIDGRVSHAVDALSEPVDLDAAAVELIEHAVTAVTDEIGHVYLRVDLQFDGQWRLSGVSACVPRLFLDGRPEAADDLVWALRAQIIPDERRSGTLER